VLEAAIYLDELNPEQRRAVEHGVRKNSTVGPPLLVIAMGDAVSFF
jgi:DNA helicase-2/ATP-dependent DNA helicase PcrA